MCGIFGQVEAHLDVASANRFARTAHAALMHRGPDGAGQVLDRHCLLGHTRLSIIDLSAAAAQPMRSASNRAVVAYNGEVYNYVELREQMVPPQGGWRSTSDTEVVLERLERDGASAVHDFVGMFAIALWCPLEQELLLVRDRFGKKPLFWTRTGRGGIRFASELGAIFADGKIPRRTSTDRVAEFLQYGYNLAPRTSFVGVESLPPGHLLRARVVGDRVEVRVERYWALPAHAPGELHDFGRWAEEFGATLEDAVRIRLRADVPIGAFLSGGVDSSVVALLASRELGGGLRTMTVDFPRHPDLSETAYAHEVAVHIEADHNRIELEPPSLEDLDRMVEIYGELHGDVSSLATVAVSRATRPRVSVALTGDGADELMGGYARYFQAIGAVDRAHRLPSGVVRATEQLACRVPPWLRGDGTFSMYSDDLVSAYASTVRQFPAHRTPPLFRAPVPEWEDPIERVLRSHNQRPPLARMMATDAETYIPGDTNVSLDRASMSVGLELRSPFLDHRLFELVSRARAEWVVDGHRGKQPLRYLWGSELPKAVFSRPKLGFGVPVVSWFRGRSFDRLADRLMDPKSPLFEIVDRRVVGQIMSGFRWRAHRSAGRLWNLLVLDAWLKYWSPTVDGA